MPCSADAVQRVIHVLELGGAAVWIRCALVMTAIVGMSFFYLFHEFRGLATSQAMDQAQIGRELLHGHGWQTKFAWPLAVGQLQSNNAAGHHLHRRQNDRFHVYLIPISDSQNTLRDILKGEYRDWAPVILRSLDLQKFPLKWATLLGLENECVLFSDHDRQRISVR